MFIFMKILLKVLKRFKFEININNSIKFIRALESELKDNELLVYTQQKKLLESFESAVKERQQELRAIKKDEYTR